MIFSALPNERSEKFKSVQMFRMRMKLTCCTSGAGLTLRWLVVQMLSGAFAWRLLTTLKFTWKADGFSPRDAICLQPVGRVFTSLLPFLFGGGGKLWNWVISCSATCTQAETKLSGKIYRNVFFVFSISAAGVSGGAVSWGKCGQTSPPPSSSTLQIASVVASGAQIITLCYFSSHTLLLKSRLPGCRSLLGSNGVPVRPLISHPSSGYDRAVEAAARESSPEPLQVSWSAG